MFLKLKEVLENSYSPYSNFRVSAVVVTNDYKYFYGVNVENASYGATICAERSAIVNAISHGVKKCDFKELHVLIDSKKISTCCFICRQVICEFFSSDKKIIIYNNTGESITYKVSELCPYPFLEGDLK